MGLQPKLFLCSEVLNCMGRRAVDNVYLGCTLQENSLFSISKSQLSVHYLQPHKGGLLGGEVKCFIFVWLLIIKFCKIYIPCQEAF